MDRPSLLYYSYLLRLWQEVHNSRLAWRASLESAQTRERFYFSGVEELVRFLVAQTVIGDRNVDQEEHHDQASDEARVGRD